MSFRDIYGIGLIVFTIVCFVFVVYCIIRKIVEVISSKLPNKEEKLNSHHQKRLEKYTGKLEIKDYIDDTPFMDKDTFYKKLFRERELYKVD